MPTKITLSKDNDRNGIYAEYTAYANKADLNAPTWRVEIDEDGTSWMAWGHDQYGEHPFDDCASTLTELREQLALCVDNPKRHEELMRREGWDGPNNPPMYARQGGWEWDYKKRRWVSNRR